MSEYTTGAKIAELRRQNNVSQEDLAAALNISRQTVYNWETDAAQPGLESIKMLMEYFHVDAAYFLGSTSSQTPEQPPVAVRSRKGYLWALVATAVVWAILLVLTVFLGCASQTSNTGDLVVANFNVEMAYFFVALAALLAISALAVFLVVKLCQKHPNVK